jgi:FKBP-type peptidyl-prolyl cis-trans isomerase
MNGEVCYSNLTPPPTSVIIGYDEVESGIHEALQYFTKGDSALVIIPSYLAHGLTGDFHKIPPNSTLLIWMKIAEIDSI